MKINKLPLVSVIIATRNSASSISKCLTSIDTQGYPKEKIEIIVVDNKSSDQTVALAGRFTNKVFFKGPERSAQRNLGIHRAEGKYILYLDSDMVLSCGVISECVTKCEDENLVALYIPERIIGEGFWVKVRDFERSFYNATVIDCVRFIRRDKVLEIDGFDETLTGPEDWDFDRRIRAMGKIGIVSSHLYHDEGKFSLKRFLDKKIYYCKNLDRYIDKWGEKDKIIKRQLGFWYRYLWVFLEGGKWKRLLAHPALTLGLYFLRLAVGIQYLNRHNYD